MSIPKTMPIRIGAVCHGIGVPCLENDGKPKEPPHPMPNHRFAALAYMTVDVPNKDPVFDKRSATDPPAEVQMIQISDEIATRLVAFVYYN